MHVFSLSRSFLGPAILLTALLSGCRDEPKPAPDGRAAQVSQDKPTAQKTTPSATGTSKPAANMPTAAANGSAAPSASAAAEAPAAPSDPPLDCDKLVTPADIEAACGVKVEAPADQPTDDIGAERLCSRRFSSKESGTISLSVVRHGSAADALDRYKEFTVDSSKPEPIEGLEQARRYEKKGASGDPIFAADAVKDRFIVSVFNPKITVGGQTIGPVCDSNELAKLMPEILKRVP